ncbi:hypothetical protein [Sphingomonas sp.]|uniref:hypothetical protein n=1 Tax=Sphingomonas sp. TaxID=28214 RepID=UPI003F719F73
MSFWSTLFDSSKHGGGEPHVRVQENKGDRAIQRGDSISGTGGGRHTHDGYNLDTASGSYREYRGGENSGDRGYNKS